MAQPRYQYGTSPRKTDPYFDRNTKNSTGKSKIKLVQDLPRQQVKVSSEQRKRQLKTTVIDAGLFLLLLTISCRNSQIDKKFNYIQDQKRQLAEIQKENEQLSVNIANSINLINLEKVAKEELGMQKLSGKQTVYVSLPKKDYVESASEKIEMEQEENVWKKIINKILNFLNQYYVI